MIEIFLEPPLELKVIILSGFNNVYMNYLKRRGVKLEKSKNQKETEKRIIIQT